MIDNVVHELLIGCTCLLIGEGGCRLCMAAETIKLLELSRDCWRNAAIKIASWELYDGAESWAEQFYRGEIEQFND